MSKEEQVRAVLADLERASAAVRATVAEMTAVLMQGQAPPDGQQEVTVT